MRFFKWRIEKAEYVDALEEIEYRFGCFLCTVTGGLLSKTNYPLEVMVSHANDYQQKICDECREEQQGKWMPTNDENKKQCSRCEVIHLIAQYPNGDKNYCPNCGAKMDLKETDDR